MKSTFLRKPWNVFSFVLYSLLLVSCDIEKGAESQDQDNTEKGVISMITPYMNQSDMASINEAYSISDNAPWGFEHRGIDFFPNADFKPFRAVSSGRINEVTLWQLQSTNNWQVSVRLIYNSTYIVNYAFEPMTINQSDGQTQFNHVLVSAGQTVSQGDTLGYLYTAGNGAHVDFSLFENGEPICPEPYFTTEAKDAILNLMHVTWPEANMCY